MEMQDKFKFTNLMVGIGEFYDKEIPQPQVDFYWQMLKKFELKDVRQAFSAHIHCPDDGQYFPKLSELLGFITLDDDIEAEQAWDIVEGVFRRQAFYESFFLTDPITQIVLQEMGESIKLRAAVLRESNAYAYEFKNRYRKLRNHFQKKVGSSE